MRPDIVFQWGDVQVADQDALAAIALQAVEPTGDLAQEAQLVGEFVILLRVGDIAAGRVN